MISVHNQQTVIPIDQRQLKLNAQKILKALKLSRFDLSILLTDDQTMRDYNRTYRHQDKPTDILSFPYHPDLKPGQKIVVLIPEDRNLGDLILAPNYIVQDLARWEQDFTTRLQVLLVHGICHLLGYDHIADQDYEIMRQEEARLLAYLGCQNANQ
ncbi:MAG TPA: rRNA maturation RNase YbeY [Candidatus Babeliales bacterium]|nr:rRNA maturation RNase YbeY [Candidatus Babeliales bacterium]